MEWKSVVICGIACSTSQMGGGWEERGWRRTHGAEDGHVKKHQERAERYRRRDGNERETCHVIGVFLVLLATPGADCLVLLGAGSGHGLRIGEDRFCRAAAGWRCCCR